MNDELTAPDADLVQSLQNDYDAVRVLVDGSIVGLGKLMFTTAVYMGLNRWGYERRYCFQEPERARAEFEKLASEDDEPAGWIAKRPEA